MGETYEDFLRIVTKDLTDNEGGINSTLFFLVDDTGPNILGAIQIRYHINHPKLIETGGHIGYGIRPSARRKGYATQMLGLALKEAKNLGIDRILITCDHDNIASVKVIEENGGKFEGYMQRDGVKSRRYWINLL
ncbi:MAG: GNAT family N-acetyltransferase [Candidatus Gracilibacteria bacterium]